MAINRKSKIFEPLRLVKFYYMSYKIRDIKDYMKNIKIEDDFFKIVDDIHINRKSLARFGDGELRIMIGVDPEAYQSPNVELEKKLQKVISCEDANIVVGLPDFIKSYAGYTYEAKYFSVWFSYSYLRNIIPFLKKDISYINSAFTRLYLRKKDKNLAQKKFEAIRKLWDDRDVVFIEGEYSRLGVGNDLFSNARSIRRIIGPATEAYNMYDDLYNEALKCAKNTLFILALGSTATVMAYDLCKAGYQALDLGHIDLEYEWYLMGAKKAVPIPGKYTNETEGKDKVVGDLSDKSSYEESIIKKIIE